MTPETPPYAQWLADHRQAAIARGGKPLPFVPSRRLDGHDKPIHPHVRQAIAGREPGEIICPYTGEIITGCLTPATLAKELGITTRALMTQLKALGIIHSIIASKKVPMISAPGLTRNECFHRSRLTPWAIDQGYGVVVTTSNRARGGKLPELELLTPDGQRYVKGRLAAAALLRPEDTSKPVKLGERIRAIRDSDPALSLREIARRVNTTRQSVQYHLRRQAA